MKLFKLLAASVLLVGSFGMSASADEPKDKVKAAFVYVGPTGDHGWTYRHDIGRQQVEEAFGDRVETTFIESVPEGADAERVMTQLAMQGNDIIFATSFGYMDPLMSVAKKFPNVKFEHATGYKQSENAANYGLKLYQARHVQGIIAGMMTKTNTICYIASFPIPEVMREINTFYLGAKKMNPDVDLKITWVYTWYDPGKEKDAAVAMIQQGCDIVAQHTDSPAPLQAAEEAGVLGFGQASDQMKFAPNAQLTATIDNWGPYYIRKVGQVLDGTWETGDYFGHMNEDAVQMAPFANMPADVQAEAQRVKDAISAGELFGFTGPINKQDGTPWLAEGEVATRQQLDTMMFYVEGITSQVPG
ncbi:BMP family ABC transporter substrate-binding protein [bacterium]|jgi:basic membrane protein A|nr:BMP family ABC transporter substrate-binding protein [bacterium]